MADTLQTVVWSLGDDRRRGQDWLPIGDDDLRAAADRLGLGERLRTAFSGARSLGYSLFLDSPLTAEQASLLSQVLKEIARTKPRITRHAEDFLLALAEAVATGDPLHVALSPPGHADFGRLTTFVHCPRCKAEGPFDRWQLSYPEEPIACPECQHIYSPAATYRSLRDPICCPSCEAEYGIDDFSDEAIRALADRDRFDSLQEERAYHGRIDELHRRFPGLVGETRPHAFEILRARDPAALAALRAGRPFDATESPTGSLPTAEPSGSWSPEEREVIFYLRYFGSQLEARRTSVVESIEHLGRKLLDAPPVPCPACGAALN